MNSKKKIFLNKPFFIALALLAFWSCKKVTYEEALPKIEIVSAQLVDEETAEITGRVINKGASEIIYTGFSFSGKPNPGMEDNQVVLNGTEGIFKTQVKVLPDSTYYFRCFAVNEFGYQLSGITQLSVPHPQPRIAPCTLAENKIEHYGRIYPISNIYSGKSYAYFGVYGVDLSNYQTGGPRVRMDFKKIPDNGIYITTDDYSIFSNSNNDKFVFVKIEEDFAAESGDSLFVSENPDGKLTISFCNLKYNFFNTPVTIRSKFICDK